MPRTGPNLSVLPPSARKSFHRPSFASVVPSVATSVSDGRAEIAGAKGDTVSLLPLGEAKGVTLSGFFYPLEDYTLGNDQTLGMSNVVTEDTAFVTAAQGDLLLFHHYGGC